MRQIVLDTETTGLQPEEGHRIIEIGCIELLDRKITQAQFHQYINPERAIDESALAIHGITNAFLKDKLLFADIAPAFMEFIQGAELIIHNAPFDIGFLNHELSLANQAWRPITDYCRIIDTLVMARQMHVGQRNSLDALCKRYNIDSSRRELHGALLDATLLAQVYLSMTGGQGSLFDEQKPIEPAEEKKQVHKMTRPRQRHLPVIVLSSEEIAVHEAKLNHMAEKGKCLWLEES